MKDIKFINFNLKRKLLLIFINISFILCGIFLIIKSNDFRPFWIIRSDWVLKVVGFVGVVYFGVLLISYLKIVCRKTALIIDDEGITDYTSFIGVGRIQWSQITEIKTDETGPISYVLIYVNDPEIFIEKNRNTFERWHLRNNFKRYRTPIAIPMVWLHIYIDDLNSILLDRFQLSKKG